MPVTQSSPTSDASPTLDVAVAQLAAGLDVEANLVRIADLVADAAGNGAQLVVLPEGAMFDWSASAEQLATAARHHATTFIDRLSAIAAREQVVVVAGMFTPAADGTGRPYNRMIAVGPDGTLLGSYDKVHLFDAFSYRESDKVRPADTDPDHAELCLFDVGPFTFGLLNCYDLRFPEMTRLLVDRDADMLLVSSAWVAGPVKEMHWETLLRARAIENTCYVVASNQPPPASVGLSMVVDPFGLVAASVVENEGTAITTLRRDHLWHARETVPSRQHRRYHVVPGPADGTGHNGNDAGQ